MIIISHRIRFVNYFRETPRNAKVFRVALSTQITDYIVTNEMAKINMAVAQDICGFRWKVEEFRRDIK